MAIENAFPMIGTKVTTTVKFSFNQSTTTSKSVSQTVPITVPGKSVGWLSDAMPVIQVKGIMIIRDGDRWWELTDAVLNLPDPDLPRVFDPRHRPMTPEELTAGGLGGTEDPPLVGVTPGTTAGEVSSATVNLAAQRLAAQRLAATGVSGDQTAVVTAVAVGLLLLGGVLIVLRRRRATR